ncbi:SecDF P1 head subdomain-containing protein [Kitasatospora sp. LaBMicrA B282]|uniref:SecDF P1 head subdomain-containing protein n=1 Tax=Kitasatospora sp. LaBMicrA B282 TaxID=3420949 RepID=UPI003D10D335
MGPAAGTGADIADCTAGQDAGGGDWQVLLRFTPSKAGSFATLTGRLTARSDPGNQLAIVLDGAVVSHPYRSQAATGGAATISAGLTEDLGKG